MYFSSVMTFWKCIFLPRTIFRWPKLTMSVFLRIFIYGAILSVPVLCGTEEPSFPKELCEHVLKQCSCYDYGEVVGIECNNQTDFRALEDGSVFAVNTTYEITVRRMRRVPSEIVRGLIVYRLYLDDISLQEMDEDAFEGVLRLRRFHVRQSALEKVPDFRPIRDSFRHLNFEKSRIRELGDGDQLKNLSLLVHVSFADNAIEQVHPFTFQGSDMVQIFDISRNKLTSLPPHLFDKWKNLRKVVLSYNQLLHVDHLFAIAHPKFISLDHNNLTVLDTVLHPNMTDVETLQLSYNPLETVSRQSFNGKIINVRFLYLDHCDVSVFDDSHYAQLQQLATLDLSYNRLTKIEGHNISFGYFVELHFTGNHIHTFNIELTFKVKRLYLNGNTMKALGPTLHFSQMTEMSVANNLLSDITVGDFKGVHETQVLDFHGNRLTHIEQSAFASIRNTLVYLDLSRNRLTRLGGCVGYLSMLTSLNLTENLIERFESTDFAGLNELTELYLEGNRIVSLGDQLHRLPRLQFLVVNRNRITTILSEQIPLDLKYLYYGDNPFRCDCALLPFLLRINKTGMPGTDVALCGRTSTLSAIECPRNCRCSCTDDPYMAIDCSDQNLTSLPQELFGVNEDTPTAIRIQLRRSPHSNILFSPDESIIIMDSVGTVDLSGNLLHSLSGPLLAGLRNMRLDNNRLGKLPLQNLNRLTSVTLSGNPWKCGCEALPLKRWISTHKEIVVDWNITRCNDSSDLIGRQIVSLTDLDLCPSDVGLYVSVSFAVLSLCLLIASMKILWMRYELALKVWLYAHGMTWVKEKDIDRDKIFDSFISFSHKDEPFVIPHIIKVLEQREQKIRLCLHYRNFLPGLFIQENIFNAVQNSKRTVLILSKNFIESEWCLLEFRAAHVQALKDRIPRIIIIKMGDLPKEIDPEIQLYLDNTTYLTWGEKHFWENLLYILPTSTSVPLLNPFVHFKKNNTEVSCISNRM